jgi:glycosyltransferase involved in cell wall biosynthesis
MEKKNNKLLPEIVGFIDYPVCVFAFPFCLLAILFAMPWIVKQRRIWKNSAKGSPRALILRGFTIEKVKKRGRYEHFLPFRNPSIKWIGILDPTNLLTTHIKITEDLHLIAWKSPGIVRILEKNGLVAFSTIVRELIAAFKIANYCVKEKIGILRAVKHNYPALQACLVSAFIKIPFIVDISGNYELISRLTGKAFYFKRTKKVPILNKLTRIISNWLLGWPIRHAFRVLGRNKNNYEHAFALGAPVDRLSLLRISNFNVAFNSFNPQQPPANPADYPYILYVGRLAKINFPLDVIDAFNLAAPQLPDYRLVIIGDGAIRDKVEKRIACSKYKDRIVFMGACPSEVVLNWTAHAKVAICPYSGSTLVEAMLCSIPVIAYDVEWHAEVVIDDYTGFLVPFACIKSLAEKMVNVIHNYDEARTVGRRGRDLARVVFDKERISKKESMYYIQALTDSHS